MVNGDYICALSLLIARDAGHMWNMRGSIQTLTNAVK
jgi:hypothetical protein